MTRQKAPSRPPDAIRRAADAGAIVLGASDQDLWQVAAAPSEYGPPPSHMETDLEGAPQTIIQNNKQLNMIDASTLQAIVQVGVDPAIALQLQCEADDAQAKATAIAAMNTQLAGEANRALAAAASENTALREEGRRVVVVAEDAFKAVLSDVPPRGGNQATVECFGSFTKLLTSLIAEWYSVWREVA